MTSWKSDKARPISEGQMSRLREKKGIFVSLGSQRPFRSQGGNPPAVGAGGGGRKAGSARQVVPPSRPRPRAPAPGIKSGEEAEGNVTEMGQLAEGGSG